jgi:glutamate racemase
MQEHSSISINNTLSTHQGSDAPIGVFDSGIGGLSVLRHIHELLPAENLLYFADSGFAPYGGKPEQEIVERTFAIAQFLLQQRAKALVVACNTATAAAVKLLRDIYPALPVIGVEPGLKPAAAATQVKKVGVMATKGTLASTKFNALHEQITAATGVQFLLQPCIGLADQVEKGELQSRDTALMLQRYVQPLIEQGIDTLVLGCTHYPFVQPLIEDIIQRATTQPIALVDTGAAVARQLSRLLEQHGLQNTSATKGTLAAFTTGSESALATAFANLLKLHPDVMQIESRPA